MKENENYSFDGLMPEEIGALKRLAAGKIREELGEKAHILLYHLGETKRQLETYLKFGLTDSYMKSSNIMVKLTSELRDVLSVLAQKGEIK